MLSTLSVVLPIFIVIGLGYGARRFALLGPGAVTELNRFVVYLALPTLLFDVTAHAPMAAIAHPGFVATFGLSCAAIFATTLVFRRRQGRPLSDAGLDALNASYANTGFIGFPLGMLLFGPSSLPPVTAATVLTVCVLFSAAIVAIEAGLQGGSARAVAIRVARSILRNPLVVAPFAGAAFATTGLALPAGIETFLKILGAAASPCALVALGLFLARDHTGAGEGFGAAAVLVSLKLVVHPLLAYLLARWVFGLDDGLTRIVVLMAALPTGTGPFMLAEFYRRDGRLTSQVILASTIASIFTVSGILALWH